MKRLPSILAMCLTAIPISCAPMSNDNAKPTAAVGGAALGAAAGGIIGHQSGRAAEGAAIGALGGGVYGWENGVRLLGGDGSVKNVERGD
ncbi:hypothetical protein ACFSSA_09230 [Luteolibacter algae]|uniref:Glycine zipper domain-containing protein n=1 Tax=Luteolibacter algae TaxID=454151 RepID=A0ABW5D7K8_9BACT